MPRKKILLDVGIRIRAQLNDGDETVEVEIVAKNPALVYDNERHYYPIKPIEYGGEVYDRLSYNPYNGMIWVAGPVKSEYFQCVSCRKKYLVDADLSYSGFDLFCECGQLVEYQVEFFDGLEDYENYHRRGH